MQERNFGSDTYLASLKILKKLSLEGTTTQCRMLGATIVSMVTKVHEYMPPSYSELIKWGLNSFTSTDLVNT